MGQGGLHRYDHPSQEIEPLVHTLSPDNVTLLHAQSAHDAVHGPWVELRETETGRHLTSSGLVAGTSFG